MFRERGNKYRTYSFRQGDGYHVSVKSHWNWPDEFDPNRHNEKQMLNNQVGSLRKNQATYVDLTIVANTSYNIYIYIYNLKNYFYNYFITLAARKNTEKEIKSIYNQPIFGKICKREMTKISVLLENNQAASQCLAKIKTSTELLNLIDKMRKISWRYPHGIMVKARCPWCNGYRRRKWTQRHGFKSWMRPIAFHIALIPLGKVWIILPPAMGK